jgi:S-adenosylmethionine synthetase
VGIGHPDKVADQISDSILDMFLKVDPKSRVACETLVSGNKVIIAGEVSSRAVFTDSDIKNTIRETVEKAGYNSNIPCEFRSDNLDIKIYIKSQSPNINHGVNREDGDIGAGDQGIMFGYATDEAVGYLPLPYVVASDLLIDLNYKIQNGMIPGIFTDNKSQVCCLYDNGNIWIEKIILSSFHDELLSVERVRNLLKREIIDPILEGYSNHIKKNPEILINSAGPFFVGGPEADAGLTGRKIIVDTYGGFAPHGGGAFSGKDPSKVDRSAAYMARHMANSLVANGYVKKALIQLSYAIGHVKPFSISVDADSEHSEEFLVDLINKNFDLSPKGIIDYLKLTDQSVVEYRSIAAGGHFLPSNAPWEKIKKF